jgi:hypothetical protein
MIPAEQRMNRTQVKELKPLLLPWLIAALGGLLPASDDLIAVVGALLSFGGFAVLCAMAFAIEFQERTFPLLLSQPVERERLWRDKMAAVALAALGLVVLNWRTQWLLEEFMGSLLGWLVFLSALASSGFWILTTRSFLSGILLSMAMQVLVFVGLAQALTRSYGPGPVLSWSEFAPVIILPALLYFVSFIWLGRAFWRQNLLFKAGMVIQLILFFGAGQLLIAQYHEDRGWISEACVAGMFALATLCSSGWWALVGRTTLNAAVLTVASQFLVLGAVLFILSRLSGSDAWFGGWGLLSVVMVGTPIYSAMFLRAGWLRFARFEVKDTALAESLPEGRISKLTESWFSWLHCRADKGWLNLVRKELWLQKPLLLLAGIFAVCWFGTLGCQWLLRLPGLAFIGDALVCIYAPLAMALAGCISLGEEKHLGVAAWNLALPISTRRQWLVKLVVAALTGLVLGLALPLCLAWAAARLAGVGVLMKETDHGWIVLVGISGGLFVLSFWAMTLVRNTIRAALTAVFAFLALTFCGYLGGWCAELTGGFASNVSVVLSADGQPIFHHLIGAFGFILASYGIALVQSLKQFRRLRTPGSAVFTNALLLAAGVVAGSYWWTAVVASAAR